MEFIPKSYDGDTLLHITLMDGQARALLVNSTALCEDARRTHTLSNVACAALGRLMTVSVMMGSMLKTANGSVTATVKGDGPLGALVAVAHEDLTVKGYVDRPRTELPLRADGKLDVGGAVGAGRLTVVRDLRLREPYVGQVELTNGEIASDFAYYFAASEQQPTLLSLGVLMPNAEDSESRVISAGGLLIQPLPDCSEELLEQLEARTSGYSDISRKLVEHTPEELCEEFFKGLEPKIIERHTPEFRCDCGRERIERALISLGREELQSMIDEDHGAQLECHFCNKRYYFTGDELSELLEKATDHAE